MSPVTRRGLIGVEIGLVEDPDGRLAVLLQLPDGFVLIKHPDQVREIAATLDEAADELKEQQ